MPLHWQNQNGSSDSDNNTCTITYDPTDGLLKVMNNNNNEILLLDMMDPNDIIGANLEICQENNMILLQQKQDEHYFEMLL